MLIVSYQGSGKIVLSGVGVVMFLFFLIFFVLTRGQFFFSLFSEIQKENERNIDWLPTACTPTRDHACLDWESNPQPRYMPGLESKPEHFGYGMMLPRTEPHGPGWLCLLDFQLGTHYHTVVGI